VENIYSKVCSVWSWSVHLLSHLVSVLLSSSSWSNVYRRTSLLCWPLYISPAPLPTST